MLGIRARRQRGLRSEQRGVTAIMTALVIVALVGMLGLVIDLGTVYVRKTELQNAADAAALAGARELNGTVVGINAARMEALRVAGLNASDFARTSVSLSDVNLQFGPSPAGPWVGVAAAQASPVDKLFVRIDTSGIAQGTRPTWFMQAANAALGSTTTSGLAVAGATQCNGLPIFTCALSAATCTPDDPANCGFIRGQAYAFNDQWKPTNPIGPGNVGWLDPVQPGSPKLINGTNEMRDLMCRGRVMCLRAPVTYSSLTQAAFNPTADALNTRFGVFDGALNKAEYKVGDPSRGLAACAVDSNVKEYRWEDTAAGGGTQCKGGDDGCPAHWMVNNPTGQTEDTGGAPGVHWSAVPPPGGATDPNVENYPASGAPYSQTAGGYHDGPSGGGIVVQPGRRVLTIGLATNCGTISGAGKPVQIAAFGEFLMQRKAFDTGGVKGFYAEFMRLVPVGSAIRPEIKLYR